MTANPHLARLSIVSDLQELHRQLGEQPDPLAQVLLRCPHCQSPLDLRMGRHRKAYDVLHPAHRKCRQSGVLTHLRAVEAQEAIAEFQSL